MSQHEEPVIPIQAVADAVPGLVAIIDREGRYRFNNLAFEEWFGAPRDQMRGRLLTEVLGPEAFEALRPYLESAFDGRLTTFEAAVPYRGGTRQVRGSYVPFRGAAGSVEAVVAVLFDVTSTAQLQEAQAATAASERRYRFLAEAGEVLASSLQYQATLEAVVRLAVPQLADWAGVDIVDESGNPRRLAIAASDPKEEQLGWELAQRYPTRAEDPEGVAKVVRTGQPELYASIPDEIIERVARDPEHARILRGLGFHSAAIVPLNARGRTFGALWFATTHSGRAYSPADLDLATRLAERAALAVDNARLYTAAMARAGTGAPSGGPDEEKAKGRGASTP